MVLPSLAGSGWTSDQIRPEYVVKADRVSTAGGINKTLGGGRVDYVLETVAGVPVAVVEAKREYREPGDGMAQALRYAQQLDVPVAYSTNGRAIVEHNLITGTERDVDSFGTPAGLWSDYLNQHGLADDGATLLDQPFNRQRVDIDGNVIVPRWYQTIAVHRALRAVDHLRALPPEKREHEVLDEDVARVSPLSTPTSTAWAAAARPPCEGLRPLRDPTTVHLDEDDEGTGE